MPLIDLEVDSLTSILERIPPEDLLTAALACLTLKTPCVEIAHNRRPSNGDPLFVTLATSSPSRARWAIESMGGRPTSKWSSNAAGRGDIAILECLKQDGHLILDVGACESAARGGYLTTLQWLRTQDPTCPWNPRHCVLHAAAEGHLAVLQWVHVQDTVFMWSPLTSLCAASAGHLAILQWMRAQDDWQKFMKMSVFLIACAAGEGHVPVLQWLRTQDPPCPWDEDTCASAAGGGHLEILQWMRAQNPPCPWDEKTCASAVAKGHLETLQWLRAQNPPCPWDASACLSVAADGGHLDVSQWIKENMD